MSDHMTVEGDWIGQDKIIVGDVLGSYTAIGKGAQVIVKQTTSYAEELDAHKRAAKRRLARAIQQKVQRFANLVETKPTITVSRNPYKSLLNYTIEDAAIFYGRDEEIKALLQRMERSHLTVLHAESGAGKTSLLEAGVASRLLADGHLPLLVRPHNRDPALAIKQSLLLDVETDPILKPLAQATLAGFLAMVCEQLSKQTVYILLDQFEEFFIELSPNKQSDFAQALKRCIEGNDLNVRFLLSLRKEYLSDLRKLRPFIANPFANELGIDSFSLTQAFAVITAPALAKGIYYEDKLAEKIIVDLQDEKEQLKPPQLQIVCSSLFEMLHTDETMITHNLYQEMGEAKGILRNHLQNVLNNNIPANLRSKAAKVLDALLTSDNRRILRSKKSLAEMLAEQDVSAQDIDQILTELFQNRLIRREEGVSGFSYELAHEYLVTEIRQSPESKARKAAMELLERELANWHDVGALMRPETLRVIAAQRDVLPLERDAPELLVKSAFENLEDVGGWLSFVPEELARQTLAAGLQHENGELRRQAAQHFSNFFNQSASEQLVLAATQDPVPSVRGAALQTLTENAPQVARGILIEELAHSSPTRRCHAAEALAGYLDQETVDHLFACVIDDEEMIVWEHVLDTLASDAARPFRKHWRPLQDIPFTRQADVYIYLRDQGVDLPRSLRWRMFPARINNYLRQETKNRPLWTIIRIASIPALYLALAWWQGFPPFQRWELVPNVPKKELSLIVPGPGRVYIGSFNHGLGYLDIENDYEWHGWMSRGLPKDDKPAKIDDPESTAKSIFSMAVNPHDSDELYIYIANHGILKSDNGGRNWRDLQSFSQVIPADDLVAVANMAMWNQTLLISTPHGIYSSTNGGENWSRIVGLPEESSILVQFSPSGLPYASTEESFYAGNSVYPWEWIKIADISVRHIDFSPASDTIYLAFGWGFANTVMCFSPPDDLGDPIDFGDNVINAIAADSTQDEVFYLATLAGQGGGDIYKVDCNGSFKSIGHAPDTSIPTDILMIEQDGYLYQTTLSGLYRLHP